MIIHIPTGKEYQNRKEAKQDMGQSYFDLALKRREFKFIENEK